MRITELKDKNFVFLILIALAAISIIIKIQLLSQHDLEVDEIYTLARAKGFTLNPSTLAYPIDLNQVVSFPELFSYLGYKLNMNSFWQELRFFMEDFGQMSNHPPLNAILAKFFLLLEDGFMGLRYYALFIFALSLTAIYSFFRVINLSKFEVLATLAIYSSMSLVNYQAIFPKGYSLSIALFFFSLFFAIKLNQSENKLFNFSALLVFSQLCFLSHYLIGLILPFAIAVIFFFKEKLARQYFFVPAIIGLGYLPYYSLLSQQAEETSKYWNGHVGLAELNLLAGNLINILSLNYKGLIAYCFLAFVIFFAYKYKDKLLSKENLQSICLILVPFLLILAIDLLFNKHLISKSRYVLVAVPFLALVLYRIFSYGKVASLAILSLFLLINMLNPGLQKFQSINLIPYHYIHRTSHLDKELLQEKTIFLTSGFNAQHIVFFQYLINESLEANKLKPIDKDLKLLSNLSFSTANVTVQDLRHYIKTQKIKNVIALNHYDKRKLPSDINFVRL